jgi:PA14 domain
MRLSRSKISLAAAFLAFTIGCTQTPTTDPSTARVNNVITSGLTGEYFDNIDFTGTKQTRVDATIDSTWGTAAPITGIAATTYSVRWTGQIQPAFTEEYTFSLTSSGQARLMINGKILVDNWTEHASQVDTGKVRLQANTKYDIRLEYARNATQPAQVKLEWQSTSQAKQVIGQTNFFSGGTRAAAVLTLFNGIGNFRSSNMRLAEQDVAVGVAKNGDSLALAQDENLNLIIAIVKSNAVKSMISIERVGTAAKLKDLLKGSSVTIENADQYFGTDGSQTESQKKELVKRIAVLLHKQNAQISLSAPAVTSSGTNARTQGVVSGLANCFGLIPPPPTCTNDVCKLEAEKYAASLCAYADFLEAYVALRLTYKAPAYAAPATPGILAKISTWLKNTWTTIKELPVLTYELADNLGGAIGGDYAYFEAWELYRKCLADSRNADVCGLSLDVTGSPSKTDVIGSSGVTPDVSIRNTASAVANQTSVPVSIDLIEFRVSAGTAASELMADYNIQLNNFFIGNVATLYPGDAFNVRFKYFCPATPKVLEGNLYVYHDATRSPTGQSAPNPFIVPVKVNCVGPKISVTPSQVVLEAGIGAYADGVINIANNGKAPLKINSISTEAQWITLESSSYAAITKNLIDPGNVRGVAFKAECGLVEKTQSAIINVFHNDPTTENPVRVDVALRCFASPVVIQIKTAFVQRGGCQTTVCMGGYPALSGDVTTTYKLKNISNTPQRITLASGWPMDNFYWGNTAVPNRDRQPFLALTIPANTEEEYTMYMTLRCKTAEFRTVTYESVGEIWRVTPDSRKLVLSRTPLSFTCLPGFD